MIIYHEFLVKGENLLECKEIVTRFLRKNGLAMPLEFEFIDKRTICATNPDFYKRITTATEINKGIVRDFLNELEKNNIQNISDILSIEQGFLSKTLHTISHILDGFFGIDAYFYNLIEDSYFISHQLLNSIKNNPDNYFIVSVEAIYSQNKTLGFEKFYKT